MKLSPALFIGLISFVSVAHANTPADGAPRLSTLDNGMRVVIEENHSAPVVAIQVWVHVGSKDETDATRGLAHIQEHMLFQGTKTYGPGTIFKTVQAAGGDFNAFTDHDQTVYHITLPKEQLATGMGILSSMMHEGTIDADLLAKELEVVMEEFRGGKQDPVRTLEQAVTGTAFGSHPYKHPVIGYQPTIQNITQKQVKDFYDNWYVPENMTLVIVGDIDPATVQKQIDQTFGNIARRDNPKRAIAPEPAQQGVRSVILKAPFENTSMEVAVRSPHYTDEDVPALDAVMSILALGDSSRLVQNVQERDRLVTSIDGGLIAQEQPYLSFIEADIDAKDGGRALFAILGELRSMKERPVSDAELARVKAQLQAALLYNRQSFNGQAHNLGFQQVIGGSIYEEQRYLNGVDDLTPQQVQAAAQKYFVPDAVTVGVLYPEQEKHMLSQARIARIVQRALGSKSGVIAKPVAQKNSGVVSAQAALPKAVVADRKHDAKTGVTTVTLKNGLTLLVREDHSTATFAAQALMLGGVRSETNSTNGISAFVSQMLMRGTDTMDQGQIAQTLDSMAAHITSASDRNTLGMSLSSLSNHSRESMTLMSQLLQNSTFPDDQVEQVRSLLLNGITRKADNPFLLSFQQLNRTMYGSSSYGLNQDGSADVIGKLQRKDLQEYAAKTIVPGNIVLSVVGDVNTDAMIDLVDATFGAMPAKTFAAPVLTAPQFAKSQTKAELTGDFEQANIFLAFPTFTLENDDRYALAVTDSILGSTAGRLFSTLRDQESLAYTVQGFIINGLGTPGFYGVYLGCDPAKTDKAIAGLEREIKKLADEGVTEREVQDAIGSITGDYVVGLQTPRVHGRVCSRSRSGSAWATTTICSWSSACER